MLATLDYKSVIRNQYNDAEKGKKSLTFISSSIGKVVNTLISPKNLLRKLIAKLSSQLISSRGLLITAQNRRFEIKDKDATSVIKAVDQLIEINISIQSLLEDLLNHSEGNKYSELHICKELILEILQNNYSVLRILKKANLKTPKETSELAKNLSKVSVNSLEKVLYGR